MGMCNCHRCGKVIVSETDSLCLSCFEEEEQEFKRIKEFLIENPLATVFQVSVTLDVSLNSIKRYLRQNRLEIIERDNQKNKFLRCEGCGVAISSGCFCKKCATTIPHNYKSALVTVEKSQSNQSNKTSISYSRKLKSYA